MNKSQKKQSFTQSVNKIQSVKIVVPSVEKQLELIYLMEKCESLWETLNKSVKNAEMVIKTALQEALVKPEK